MHRIQISSMLALVTLAVAACAQARPAPVQAPTASLASPPSTAVPTLVRAVPQPSTSPSAVAGPHVNIVEPAFRPPQEWTYTPAELTVKVGTAVMWTNTGAVAHTVTADDGTSFDSGSIDPKASFTFAPSSAGTFAYHCTFHPWMKATLVVTR